MFIFHNWIYRNGGKSKQKSMRKVIKMNLILSFDYWREKYMFNSKTTINIALLGFGTVGQGIVDILQKEKEHLENKCGKKLAIAGIAVRNLEKKRDINLPKSLFTTDSEQLATREDVDVVFELMGGIDQARTCVLQALRAGKPVVTANKALLAEYAEEIFSCAREYKLPVGYEASVAAAVPVIRFLRDGLASSQISEIEGILNGTTNFILSQMQEKGQNYEEAFNLAESLGYLEADPSLDVDGWDAAHKLVILASIAFKKYVKLADVEREGIARVTADEIEAAKSAGKVIKLVASARKKSGKIQLQVRPQALSDTHVLARVGGGLSGVRVQADRVGDFFAQGPGAGALPTASAVLSDLIAMLRHAEMSGFGF
ncbi:MAG: homoserine dehydrogenase [Calditrichaeota bacterium]|nr:MAG: homoserine dehydrogenase [Calditrichota bacterium]